MNCRRTWTVVLIFAAMLASGALHAQVSLPAPRMSIAQNMQDETPCPRDDGGTAWHTICAWEVRSTAFSLAWEKGVDLNGVKLDAAARARMITELEAWLDHLVGQYRVDGTYLNTGGVGPVAGTATCRHVVGGPGVQCEITATVKHPDEPAKNPPFDEAITDGMRPLIILFGIDPDTQQIKAGLVDSRATEATGRLLDDAVLLTVQGGRPFAVTFTPDSRLVWYAWYQSLIRLQPDGGLDMKFTILGGAIRRSVAPTRPWTEFDLQLHRETPLSLPAPASRNLTESP
jgi:hypothetical protein